MNCVRKQLIFFIVFFLLACPLVRAENSRKSPDLLTYPPLKFAPPLVKQEKLPSGITVFFLENYELPIVHISVYVRAGSNYDPPGKEGLAEITAQVMRTGGAGKRTGSEIDSHLDRMSARIEPIVRDEYTLWRINVLAKDLKETWNIFQSIMRAPLFDTVKLNTALDLKKGELRRLADNPEKLAFREFQRLYFHGNVIGRLPTEASIGRISREDVLAFHRRHFFPSNITVAVSGAVSREEILSLLTGKFLEGWKNEEPLPTAPPPVWTPPGKTQCLIKDTPQAVIITGQPAPSRLDTDYYPFEILDFILGSGGFRSRIFQEVRTNLGLSYSTGSFYRPRSNYGLFGTYVITQNKSAFFAFSTVKNILQNAKNDIDKREVERAKNAIINSFVFDYGTPRQIVEREAEASFFGWPEDFWRRYVERISRVSPASVLDAARKHLLPDKMQVFILGKEEACSKFPAWEKVDFRP